MRKDVIFPFSGPSYGTTRTCEIQGYFSIAGSGMVVCMGIVLNVYYLCTLTYNMPNKVFSRRVEPLLYFIAVLGIAWPLTTMKREMINPVLFGPLCQLSMEYDCGDPENPTHSAPGCRGDFKTFKSYEKVFLTFLGDAILILMSTMALIVAKFYKNEIILKKSSTKTMPTSATDNDSTVVDKWVAVEHATRMRRHITNQAVLYVACFWLTWGVTMACVVLNTYWMQALRMLTYPSQGFFNMLIFFYHKVLVLRKSDKDLTTCEALEMMFFKPRESEDCIAILSNVSLVFQEFLRIPAYEYEGRGERSRRDDLSSFGDGPLSLDVMSTNNHDNVLQSDKCWSMEDISKSSSQMVTFYDRPSNDTHNRPPSKDNNLSLGPLSLDNE